MRAKRLVALLLILTLCFGAAGGTVSATSGEGLNGTQESTAPTTEDGTDPQQDDATEPVADTQQTLSAGHDHTDWTVLTRENLTGAQPMVRAD